MVIRQTFFVTSTQNQAHSIFVRVAKPQGTPKGLMVFAHGANLSSLCFDLPCYKGQTWLEYAAHHGLYACALDYRGYGRSSRYGGMDGPPQSCKPLGTHHDATQDVLDVINHVHLIYPGLPLTLVGYSWGSGIAGYMAQYASDRVSKLVLLGAVYAYPHPEWESCFDLANPGALHPNLGSYRVLAASQLTRLWDREIPGPDKAAWRDSAIVDALVNDALECDKTWAQQVGKEGHIRVPTGVLVDACRVHYRQPLYDAAQVKQPALIMRGDHDTASLMEDMAGLLQQLGTPDKAMLTIQGATHYGMLERCAIDFWQPAIAFALA